MDELAQSAMDAVTDGRVKIIPERYAKGYLDWLSEKRDWPIGRQLWWGHRIPVWYFVWQGRSRRRAIHELRTEAAVLTAAGRIDVVSASDSEETGTMAAFASAYALSQSMPRSKRSCSATGCAQDADVSRHLVQFGPLAAFDARLAGADARN